MGILDGFFGKKELPKKSNTFENELQEERPINDELKELTNGANNPATENFLEEYKKEMKEISKSLKSGEGIDNAQRIASFGKGKDI